MPKSLISTHCNLKTTDMQFLNRGYVVNKIKEYFTRKMPEEEQNPEFVPKEMVKLSVQTSTMTVDTNRDYEDKVSEVVKQRRESLNPMLAINYREQPLQLKNARGQFLFEENGNKVLDCINNVSHIGHCHPYFVTRMNAQNTQLLTNSRYLYDELMVATHKLLNKLPPQLSVVTFVNSGSEANDLAMQMAQIHTRKKGIICFEGAYHGVTSKCLDVSPYKWNEHYAQPEHVSVADIPCFYRGKYRQTQEYAEHFKKLISEKDGAFICEYMQSCGGQVIPPRDFYQQIYRLAREKGLVCIGDEVQTGFGRLGNCFWAFEHYDVVPDILTVGKAMGNGFPVSAVICTKEIAQSYGRRGIEFFSTFGGNPLAVTATSCVLDVIAYQKLQENAKETGDYLNRRLKEEILPFYDFVGDIRGMGFFQGIDIVKSKESREEDGELAKKIITRMRERLILVSRDGPKANVLKFKPPLVFSKVDVDTLIDNLKATFSEITFSSTTCIA